jgi:hypothetical protein
MEKIKFYLAKLGFYLLSETREGSVLINNLEIDKTLYDKLIKRGRIAVIMDLNISGGERQIMVGDMRKSKMTHQEVIKVNEAYGFRQQPKI